MPGPQGNAISNAHTKISAKGKPMIIRKMIQQSTSCAKASAERVFAVKLRTGVKESRLAGFELSFCAKKILKDCGAFILQDAGCNVAPVVPLRYLQQVHHASCGPCRWICATKDHAPDPCMHERAGAHRARFLCHVKIAVDQSPIANRCFSLR